MSEYRAPGSGTEMPSSQQQLLGHVGWFNRLRFGAVVGMICAALFARALDLLVAVAPVFICAGITLALNLIYIWRFRSLCRASFARVRAHVYQQIGLDLLILTAVLHYSGGSTNPLSFFFFAFSSAALDFGKALAPGLSAAFCEAKIRRDGGAICRLSRRR